MLILKIKYLNNFNYDYYMKKARLEDGSYIYCISKLEAQMLDIHVSGYFDNGIILNDGDTVIDVGANIGMFGHKLSKKFHNINIIALEPIKNIFNVLKENAKNTNNNKYKTYHCGLSDKNEFLDLYYYPNCPAMSTSDPNIWKNKKELLSAFEGSIKFGPKFWWWSKYIPHSLYPLILFWLTRKSKKVKCELKTLSYIIRKNNLKEINLLKIDCEGNELNVLKGIDADNWQMINQIVLEVHDINNRFNKVKNLLNSHGFKICTSKEPSLVNTNLLNIIATKAAA